MSSEVLLALYCVNQQSTKDALQPLQSVSPLVQINPRQTVPTPRADDDDLRRWIIDRWRSLWSARR